MAQITETVVPGVPWKVRAIAWALSAGIRRSFLTGFPRLCGEPIAGAGRCIAWLGKPLTRNTHAINIHMAHHRSMVFTRDFVKEIDWEKVSRAAEAQAISDPSLAMYFEYPENFSVAIDYSFREDDISGPEGLTEFLRVTIRTDAKLEEDATQEDVIQHVLDNYVFSALQSLGEDWEEFYHDWFMGIQPPDCDISSDHDIHIGEWIS